MAGGVRARAQQGLIGPGTSDSTFGVLSSGFRADSPPSLQFPFEDDDDDDVPWAALVEYGNIRIHSLSIWNLESLLFLQVVTMMPFVMTCREGRSATLCWPDNWAYFYYSL